MNTDDIVNQFANTLQNRNTKPSILYGEKKNDSSIYKDVKVKDVITIISKQLKAIKNADSVRQEVRSKTLCIYKQLDVPANYIPMEVQSDTENKIETQCILDTQLIDLIKHAESVIDAQNNSQKTDNAVCQEIENSDREKNNIIRKCNKNPDKTLTLCDNKNIDVNPCQNNDFSEENHLNNVLKVPCNKNKIVEASGSSQKTREINDCFNDNNELNDSVHSSANELEVPNSPILGIVKHISKPQPLIYTLEAFDKFESLAAPVMNEITNFDDAKRIINSHLKAIDYFVKTHSEIVTSNKEIEGRDLCKFINKPKTQYSFDINSGVIDYNVVEDEMVFDSDDDIQYSEELPLTSSLETSVSNNTQVLDKTMYVGFQTASNRSIQILSDSFKKAKDVFDNVSKTVAENLSITELVEAFDRKTSHEADDVIKEKNNDIINKNNSTTPDAYLSGENINEYKDLTQNVNGNLITEHIDEHIMREFENNLMPSVEKITVKSIHEEMTSKHSSNGIDNSTFFMETNTLNKTKMDENSLNRSSNQNLMGFKTASNKIISISDQALTKTRNIFDDIDLSNTEKYFKTDLAGSPKKSNNDFVGFKTANNKKIKISAEAILNTKNIYVNIDNEISSSRQNDENDLQSIKRQGLKTEPIKSGFINSISPKNIQMCATFPLKETDKEVTGFIKNNKIYTNCLKYKVTNNLQEFKTANNKNVIISDNTFKKPTIFQAIEESTNTPELDKMENELNLENNITDVSFKGFKTANNKPIKISDEALLKTKTVFQDIENGSTYPADGYLVPPSILQGFTSNKKTVVMSQEALSKPKILFQDVKDNNKSVASNQSQQKITKRNSPDLKPISVTKEITPITDKLVKKTCFAGFQTASNKIVQISEEALIKSKKIFDDIDFNNKNKDTHDTDANFKGFCTASNKKVQISEDALVKSGKTFENLCDQNQYCEEEPKKNIKAKLKNPIGNDVNVIKKPDTHKSKEIIIHEENKINENCRHIEDFLNTDIIKIFDESLHTEDFFEDTIPKCKRSGSPILSCAKAKKKKFETPKNLLKIMQREIKIVKPLNLFKFDENYKKIKKYKLSDILAEKSEKTIENIDPYLFDFNFDTFLHFRFENNRNDIDNDSWTTDKVKTYFTNSVNKKNIPEGWIDNHLKLIIWKLISYEFFSPKHMKYVCSVKNVLQQLKYRYDRELYNVERPALRKILEKDDVSTKLMILCVASLYVDGVRVNSVTNQIKNIELLLTDGWYCVRAKADDMIEKLIIDGKISIGTKLAIHGAELMNCEQGISPWEDTSKVRLKISGNSTKRAKRDARLGFHGNSAMISRLTAVRLEGGKISKLRLFVTRVYPTMYVEKFEDGSTVTRSERLEHLHQMKCETERQIQMEKLYEEVVKMSEQESDDSEELYTEQGNFDTGSQISRLMKKSKDPLEFKATLTSSQRHMLNVHTDRQNEKLIQKIQNKAQLLIKKRGLDVARNVVPLMKVRVFDERKAMITIWRPNESLLDLIKEGAWIDVYNVVPTSIRYSEIQISAGRQSMFCKSKIKQTEKLRTLTETLNRKCYTIKDLQSAMTTNYNEIDTFGLVFLIEPKDYDGSKELFQNVYVCGVDKSIISVNFWGGVKKFGFENILEIGQTVACVNLQKRAGNTRYIPQYRATEYTYFTKTPKFDCARKLLDEFTAQLLKTDKHKIIKECVDLKNNYWNLKYSNTENVSPYRMNNSEYNISRNKMFIESPLIGKDLNSNLETHFKQTRELSPNSLLRKKKVDEKIAKLRIYGEPPPLNHIHMINKSSKAIRPYKSPLISNNTSPRDANTNFKNISNVTSGTLSVNKISSPVLNRTFVKINPVKLNFALEENNFAEELDSPPLSLDLIK